MVVVLIVAAILIVSGISAGLCSVIKTSLRVGLAIVGIGAAVSIVLMWFLFTPIG